MKGLTLIVLRLLPDGHGAEDVEEDEAAVSHIFSQQVSVAQPLPNHHQSNLELKMEEPGSSRLG